MKWLVRAYRAVNVFLERTALILLVVMTFVTIYRVTTRYFFNFTPSWTEELSCILMIWLAMIGLAVGVRERMHLGITVFYDRFPVHLRKAVDAIILLMQASAGVYLVLAGTRLSVDQFRTTMSAVKLLPFSDRMMPNSVLYVVVPVAGALIVVYTLIQVFDSNNLFQMQTLKTDKEAPQWE